MKVKFVFTFLILGILSSCSTSDYNNELGDGYLFVSESNALQFITGPNDSTGTGLIPCTVEAFAYDDIHIIARQKNNPDCSLDDISKISANYWIIDKKKKTSYGPLDSLTFNKRRVELSVSTSLDLDK